MLKYSKKTENYRKKNQILKNQYCFKDPVDCKCVRETYGFDLWSTSCISKYFLNNYFRHPKYLISNLFASKLSFKFRLHYLLQVEFKNWCFSDKIGPFLLTNLIQSNTMSRELAQFSKLYVKSVLVFCYQNCSSDRKKLLKFEAGDWEFAKVLRSLKQFIQTVRVQNNFW